MRRDGQELSENEAVIADAFGSGDELDVAKPSLAFDIAAVIGREVRENYWCVRLVIVSHINIEGGSISIINWKKLQRIYLFFLSSFIIITPGR